MTEQREQAARDVLAKALGWDSDNEARKWVAAACDGKFNGAGCKVDVTVAINAILAANQLASQPPEVREKREAIARIVGQHQGVHPWWWDSAFDDGMDTVAVQKRDDDYEAADAILAIATPNSAPEVTGGEVETLGRFGHHPDARTDYEVEVDALIGMAYERLTIGGRPDLEDRIWKAMDFQTIDRPGALRWLNQRFRAAREIYARKPDWVDRPAETEAEPTPEETGSESVDWRHKLWMIACHATGGGIPEIEGVDRSINDICVQISAHHNAIWKHAQESALAAAPSTGGDAVLREAARRAHDTLIELNPANYTHDDVCEANDAAVEAILLLADALGETHGKTPEWWAERRQALSTAPQAPTASQRANGWQDIASAPNDGSTIMLWAEVDGGERGAAYGPVMAAWVKGYVPGGDELDIGFGEEGGWLVSFTDDSIASAERPTHWMPTPSAPAIAALSTAGEG